MKTRHIFLFIVASIALIGCARNFEDDINPMDKDIIFKASWEDSSNTTTKTVLQEDGTSVWWSTDEKISVFYGSTRSGVFTSTNTSPAAEASFSGTLALKDGVTEESPSANYWAVYPYNENNTCDGESVTLTIPANQTATEGTFADNFFPAVARSKNSKLSFYNVCGGVRFSVYNEGITSVTIKSNAGESLVGTVKVAFDENGKPYVSTITAGGDMITVTAPEGGFVPGKYYFAAIAPQTLSSGLKLTYVNSEAKRASITLDKSITVSRSRFGIQDEKDKNLNFVLEGNIQFADPYFKAYCVENFDKDGDGEISISEALAVTRIDVNTDNIESLQGVESFKNITHLLCKGTWNSELERVNGRLTSLDVGKNTALVRLDCYYNQLTSLDVSNNTDLSILWCDANQLASLDVSNNTALTSLKCYDNQLSSLDVSNNTALSYLSCYNNQLTSLDVSKNTALTTLWCDANQLASLNVSNNKALTSLKCYNNQLTTLDVSKNTALIHLSCDSNQLSSLDVSKNTALTTLSCTHNQLSSLDVSKNTALTTLYCESNQLSSLDVSKNTALTKLGCRHNQLSSLDVSKNTALTVLGCYANQLASLDVSKNTALTELDCDSNQLSSLDVSNNTALTYLNCSRNQLSSLGVIKNTALVILYCESNQLSSLDVSNNTALTELNCLGNPSLTEIWLKTGQTIQYFSYDSNIATIKYKDDFSESILFTDANFKAYCVENFDTNGDGEVSYDEALLVKQLFVETGSITSLSGIERFENLEYLFCCGNESGDGKLTSLDVSNNKSLSELYCYNNQLTELNVKNNTELVWLWCYNNQLTELDVNNNIALEDLWCHNNQLKTLDLSNNSALKNVNIGFNQLADIDVRSNKSLVALSCNDNQLKTLDVTNNLNLSSLYCFNNQLTELNIINNTSLEWLWCSCNPLGTLDVSNNTRLKNLDCGSNSLTSLDLSTNASLQSLTCHYNQLLSLDVSNNLNLQNLNCASNPNLSELWLKEGQTIAGLEYDSNITTIKYRGIDDIVQFTDANFKAYCVVNFDKDGDGEISISEALVVTSIDVCTDNITSIGGVEFFSNLETLNACGSAAKYRRGEGNNGASSGDTSNLPDPTIGTSVASGKLTEMDLSSLQKLQVIDISRNNSISGFNPDLCPSLRSIICQFCNISSLDVSKNTMLAFLSCPFNQLTTIDVSHNPYLASLWCDNNQLTTLDVSSNVSLTKLSCNSNQLAVLDISKNTALESFDCGDNLLSTLDVSKNTTLTRLDCSGNELKSLDVGNNSALESLGCSSNQLTALDVGNNTKLLSLVCHYNQLAALDVSHNTLLQSLICAKNQLTTLDVSNNTALATLWCHDNLLTSLDVCNNMAITSLICYNNPNLTELWLKTGQTIRDLQYDSNVTTIKYK